MEYPPAAYASNGILWWELKTAPGTAQRFGSERKAAAWLAFHKKLGDTFTTEELRLAIGVDGKRNDNEHAQRRLRQLRKDGWEIPSVKYVRDLKVGEYRIDTIGWYPGCGRERPKNRSAVSARIRSMVLKRDGSRCQICGVGDGEAYPGEPGSKAAMTVGHLVSDDFGGPGELGNLRVECARCNEPVRSERGMPESPLDVIYAARLLKRDQVRRLASWVSKGSRTRDALDEVYDRYRKLAPGDRNQARSELLKLAGDGV
ncbi:HNH endonuclease signature motif containing protein [Nocardia sp. NPDC006630]|uniref:HNH endonuclease n=1 Tax=Nocardia sp. NPDC006630 TaxID=3157181 RepID=UPI0033A92D42